MGVGDLLRLNLLGCGSITNAWEIGERHTLGQDRTVDPDLCAGRTHLNSLDKMYQ
jgi:hypothetical protein